MTAAGTHGTAQARRRIAMASLGRELDAKDHRSAARRLRTILDKGSARPMAVSGDIDGVVASSMLGSVAPHFKVAALVINSEHAIVHPDYVGTDLKHFFGVDLFSIQFDNISNHVEFFGDTNLRVEPIRLAFGAWDEAIREAEAHGKFFGVPSIWAKTQGGRENPQRADAATYKYPFGTAQILLALLEAAGRPPKFLDQTYLPWLVANADGGVTTFSRWADNSRVWWPVLAGAVGPGSLTAEIYNRVRTMRPHDFRDAVHQLDREFGDEPRFLNDDWNLQNHQVETMARAYRWLIDLTGWVDPIVGGVDGLSEWRQFPLTEAKVHLSNWGTKDVPKAVAAIQGANLALNVNFRHGGKDGSRFNWVGPWS